MLVVYSEFVYQKIDNLFHFQEDEFVRFLTEGQPAAPDYFSHDVQQNIVS